MIRATTMFALAVMSAAWVGLGCESADYVPGGGGGAAGSSTILGTGGAGSEGTGGHLAQTGGSGGADQSTGGSSGSTGGSAGSTGGTAGAGGATPGAYVGTSTVNEEMLPPAPVYDDTGALYVSTNGSDSAGNGSKAAPFKTIPHALEVGGDGAIIVLRGTPHLASGQNVYAGQVRIRSSHVTIRSEQGE